MNEVLEGEVLPRPTWWKNYVSDEHGEVIIVQTDALTITWYTRLVVPNRAPNDPVCGYVQMKAPTPEDIQASWDLLNGPDGENFMEEALEALVQDYLDKIK